MMNFSTFLGKEKETFESRKKQNFKINPGVANLLSTD
jgi:hypothetical protein